MTYRHDFHVHLDENLVFEARLLDNVGAPINFEDYDIEMAMSLEPDTPTIDTISYPSDISAIDANTGVIGVNYKFLANTGFTGKDHYYQLRVVEKTSNAATVMIEGRIFIQDSLFD